jgi:hypothetical protein
MFRVMQRLHSDDRQVAAQKKALETVLHNRFTLARYTFSAASFMDMLLTCFYGKEGDGQAA